MLTEKKRASRSEAAEPSPGQAGVAAPLDRFFGLGAAGSSVGTEFRAGLATFLIMACIMFVNPAFSRRPAWTTAPYLSPPALPLLPARC
jgi:hypothetical protein